MLLAIDVGNTNITVGLFKGGMLFKKYAFPTATYAAGLKKINPKQVDSIIISSVVPKATKILERSLKKTFGIKPIIVGRDIIVPIKNRYRNPKQVGQDRLVNAYAGVLLYGAPCPERAHPRNSDKRGVPLIIIDFGTAITFDLVSAKGEYLGGIITPGMGISLDALNQRTALLPKISLAKPKELIGRDTRQSMLSGIIYGFASLTDGLIDKLKLKLGKKARVIGTGGNISLIASYCKKINIIDQDLTLKGLHCLA